jgi:hypothetical protein
MANTFNFSDIFISYSRRDKEFVQHIAKKLNDAKYNLWVDWEDIPATVDWWREIQAGIESSNIFVFIISTNSALSDVCRQEIDHAVANHKRIIPILYEAITDNAVSQKLHPSVTSHNWIIYDANGDFEAWFAMLVNALQTDIDYVRHHTRILVRAREWDIRGRDDSFLLRGTDADEAELWLTVAHDKKPAMLPLQQAYIEASIANAKIEAEIKQRQKALVLLDTRSIPAFLFSAAAMAFYIWNTYGARFDVSAWRVAMGIGILFGICVGAIVLYADELVKIRFPNSQQMRFATSSAYAFVFASAAWSVIQLIYFDGVDLMTISFGGLGLALGFVLNATFDLRSWQAFLITIVATYIPIYFGAQVGNSMWSNDHIPLLYFQWEIQRFTVGLPLAFFITIGGYAFALWREISQFIGEGESEKVKGTPQ